MFELIRSIFGTSAEVKAYSAAIAQAEDAGKKVNQMYPLKQAVILNMLSDCKWEGATWKEVVKRYPQSFNQEGTKRLFVKMHRSGEVVRLAVPRERCKVYVLPEYANERVLEAPGSQKRCAMCNSRLG